MVGSIDGHWKFRQSIRNGSWEGSGVLSGSARRACSILWLRVHESSDRKHHRADSEFVGRGHTQKP